MKNTVIALLAAGVLIGCGGNSKTPAQKIAELEASGAIPRLERSDTIEGIDANNNGVRDDIEAYILSEYSEEEQRKAAMQYARGMQNALLIHHDDIDAAKKAQRQLSQANNCLYLQFEHGGEGKPPGLVAHELISITTNTKPRLKAYLSYSKALDGTSWALPRGNTCE